MAAEQYFPGAFILGSMLKHVGCQIPFHLWVNPDAKVPEKLAEVATIHRWERREGIEAERTRLLLTLDFEKVFWLGCDCYPVVNLDYMFDDCDEAIFWREVPGGQRFDPADFGLPASAAETTFQIQGDTVLLDLDKCRKAIGTAHAFNMKPERFFARNFGDQATFRAAWALHGMRQFSYSPEPVDWQTIAHVYLHLGKDLRPAIVHRLGSKWPMMWGQPPSYIQSLAHEAAVWQMYRGFTGSHAFSEMKE